MYDESLTHSMILGVLIVRAAVSSLTFFGILLILGPENKGTVGQSWRACLRFILQEDFKGVEGQM